MYDHVGFKVKDLDLSIKFYKAALAPLGYTAASSDQTSAGFGGGRQLLLTLCGRRFRRSSRRVWSGRAHGRRWFPPRRKSRRRPRQRQTRRQERLQPTYYAAFLIDPDGNNIEAVCTN